jgi:class 3 adenylate cyclase
MIDRIPNLTILFADISGFTEYSSTTTPKEVYFDYFIIGYENA